MFGTKADIESAQGYQLSVIDLVERAKSVALSLAPTAKRRTDTWCCHKQLLSTLNDLEQHILKSEINAVALSPAVLSQMAHLSVPLSMLKRPLTVANNNSGDKLQANVGELDRITTLRGYSKLSTISEGILNFMPRGKILLEKCCHLATDSKLPGDQWAPIPKSVLFLFEKVISLPHLYDVVETEFEKIRRMIFVTEDLEQQQQGAVADGEMKMSETLYYQKIVLQESMVEHFDRLYAVIDRYEREELAGTFKEIRSIHDTTNAQIMKMMRQDEDLKIQAKDDIKKLKDTESDLKINADRASKEFYDYLNQNERQLEENAKQADNCFAAIMELEKRIASLAESRVDLVQQRLDTLQKEQKRKNAIESFNSFAQDRSNLLFTTVKYCEAADALHDLIDEFTCNACNTLDSHMRDVEADLIKRREEAHEMRLAHFRGLYLTLGELEYKKERNLEELDKKISYAHIQQDMAMDALNPKAKEFAHMKNELLKVREAMGSQIEDIKAKEALQIEAFKPTEMLLIKAGKNFISPADELEQINQQRQQKLLEYHRLMGEEDVDENGGRGNSPKKFLDEVLSEKRAVEELRASLDASKTLRLKAKGAAGVGREAAVAASVPSAAAARANNNRSQMVPSKVSENGSRITKRNSKK